MTTTIGIVGAGIAGLHLALYLQKHGIGVTLYSDRAAEELSSGKLPSSVALMGATLGRDGELGTNHWERPELGTFAVDIRVAGDPPLVLHGALTQPFLFIDMRVYLPTLMKDFTSRGGKLVVARCTAADVGRLAAGSRRCSRVSRSALPTSSPSAGSSPGSFAGSASRTHS